MGAYKGGSELPSRAAWLTSTALVIAVVLIAALAPPALVGWHAWQARTIAIERGFSDADDLVLSLSQHAARTFSEPQFILQDVVEHVLGDGTGPAALRRLQATLVSHIKTSRIVREVGVLDERGYWLTSSLPERPTHSNGDRDYFVYHRDHPNDKGLRINTPIVSRLTGKWTILVTRRIDHADDRFAGIVLASISTEYFQKFYDTLNIGPFGHVGLYRSDARLLVRRPFVEDHLLTDRSVAFFEATQHRPSGRYHGPSAYDGVVRLASWRTLEEFPLIMTVSRAESDVLAGWRSSVTVDAAIGAAASLVILILGTLSILALRRRMEAERAAAEIGRQYELIAQTASDVIVHVGADGRRRYISPACRDVLGYEPEELMGGDLMSITHPDDCALLERALGSLRDGATRASAIYRARHRNGHYIWVEVNFRAVGPARPGAMPEIMGSTRDISARKMSELQFARAKEAAESASRAKSNFLSGMSHELRTPLNAIIGFSDLMARELYGPLQNPRYAEYVQDIKSSGEHLLQLINDILDHAKIESGQFELHEAILDLADEMQFAVHLVALQAERAKQSLDVDVKPGIRLFADERRIRQILLNLLSNAIKYTPEQGHVRVSVEFSAYGNLLLMVSDTGIGMSSAEQERALQPFMQVDNESNRSQQGTGLGLTLTRRLAELHGGHLDLRSAPGKGTTVIVELPASRVVARPA